MSVTPIKFFCDHCQTEMQRPALICEKQDFPAHLVNWADDDELFHFCSESCKDEWVKAGQKEFDEEIPTFGYCHCGQLGIIGHMCHCGGTYSK